MLPCPDLRNPSSVHRFGRARTSAEARTSPTVSMRMREPPHREEAQTSQALISAAAAGEERKEAHHLTAFEHHASSTRWISWKSRDSRSNCCRSTATASFTSKISPQPSAKMLVTIMYANNEIARSSQLRRSVRCARSKCLFHADAVQAGSHIKIDVKSRTSINLRCRVINSTRPKAPAFLRAGRERTASERHRAAHRTRRRTRKHPGIVAMAATVKETATISTRM